jgi:peptidoglycan/xylan/chitin deacetylase (PgdA/CDA1 family)
MPILMYHYVRPDPGPDDPIGRNLSVSPETFDAQMSHLAHNGFTTMTMGDLADVRAGRKPLPPKPVVLTLDDGYRDFYTHAWPVLQKYGIKATSFIITDWVDQPHYVTWQMIDEMAASGLIEFGSHTRDHKELPRLRDDHAGDEIVESKKTLEAHLGQAVRSFCYPAGKFTPQDAELVSRAGYEIAVTTEPGFAKADDSSVLLPKVRINGSTTLPRFAEIFD